MNKSIVTSFVIVFSVLFGHSQNSAEATIVTELEKIPQERVYLSYNESALFSGEDLKYKLYCFNVSGRSLSTLSKIGYVSMISENGSSVFDHKIHLDSGSGYGDFFIPTDIPTGSYKLLGYTEWMKNEGVAAYFQSDVFIINPYQPIPFEFVEAEIDSLEVDVETTASEAQNELPKIGNRLLKLTIDEAKKGKRERIEIGISALGQNTIRGSYSLSVRKIEATAPSSKISAEQFLADLNKSRGERISLNPERMFFPELRGELISGTVIEKISGQPIENIKISLSLPGEGYLFKIATSDAKGRFHFNLGKKYDNDKAMVQILSDDWSQFEIEFDSKKSDFGTITFDGFKLSREQEDYILERSIQNQIENAYQEARSDTILRTIPTLPFYRSLTTSYDLDDYTRFNSISETIVEVVDHVGIRKLSDGNQVFEIRPEEGLTNNALLPMVFVDGLFIKKHQDFMGYSAKNIKRISFSRDNFVLGTQKFQGVLSFETIEGNYFENFYTPHIVNIDLYKPRPQKVYFNQEYSGNLQEKRLPDFRHELLWIPNVNLSEATKKVAFYTSDITGDFEVILEGFTTNGLPVYIKKKLTVH